MDLSVSTTPSRLQGVFGLLGALSISTGLSWKKTPKPQARAPLQGLGHATADVCLLAAQPWFPLSLDSPKENGAPFFTRVFGEGLVCPLTRS